MSFINEAFDRVCKEAEASEDRFVSLYERTNQYGGPEEGGWYRADVWLIKTMRFSSLSAAKAASDRIAVLCLSLTDEAAKQWSARCSREIDWCDDRGLEADYLGEPDGPSDYFVAIETVAGSREYRDSAVYE